MGSMMKTILIAAKENDHDFSTSIAICAAILFVSAWLMLRGRMLRQRTREPKNSIMPVQPSVTEETALEHAAEVYDTIRELTGQLDNKIRLLNFLIEDADRAASRLEAARRGEAPPARTDRTAESLTDEICLYADYGFTASDIASRLEIPVGSVERVLGSRG